MKFVHPGLLIGLLLGSIPILVYYLMRFRSMRVSWGADYILERALARRRKKVYWDQIILLALRALVVMALVMAFARPQSTRDKSVTSDGAVLRILLVDCSYSMLARDGDQTRRDVAQEALRALVSSWGRSEAWSLYVMDSNPRWIVQRALVKDAKHSLAIVDGLQSEETAVSLAAGLKTVLAHGAGQRREIYLFTDDQASNWEGVDKVTASLDANTRLFWIRPPLESRRNLAVTDLQVSHERVLRGAAFSVLAQVRNFTDSSVRDAEIKLLVDGRVAGLERLSLPPGQSTRVRLETRIDDVGSHLLTARLNDDVLSFDNALSAGVEVTESVSLLVLRDEERSKKFESSAGLLTLAARMLAGGGTNRMSGPLRVVEHTAPGCELSVLAGYDAVLLDGGRQLTPQLAESLAGYVKQGGGLVLAADESADLPTWRKLLGPLNLLPALPLRTRSEPVGGEACRRLSGAGFELPALKDLESRVDGDISQVRFYNWTEFDTPAPGAEVLARFADGSPYAWRRRFDCGGVLLLAAGLNSNGNNLMVRETVYPFLLHLFSEVASAGQYTRRVGRNQPVRYLARGEPAPIAVQFGLEGEEPVLAALTPHPKGTRVEYGSGVNRSGAASLLVLRENARERIWIGIQGERTDSDLTPMSDTVHARLAEQCRWTEVSSAKQLMETLASAGHGAELYGWVILALLLFGIGEVMMGLRFI